MSNDTIKISVLEDGTIKMETDRISMPNHANAEAFLRACFELAGGKAERQHKHGMHLHEHAHAHEHQH